MRNEREAVSTEPRSKTGRVSLLVLAAALFACGSGSGKSSRPGSPTLSSIALTPATVTIATGAQQQLAVIGSYSDSTTAPITSGIDWSSSNPSVATVAASGLATSTNDASATGTSTITATVSGLSAQASLTVTPPALVSVTVEPPSATVVEALLQPFSAKAHYANGTSAPLVTVTWASSDTDTATIDDSGFAVGRHSGVVTITATHPGTGKSSTAQLTITDPVLESVAVSPASSSVPATFSRQFTAVGQFTGGHHPDLTGITWSSSNTAVATVNATTGLARGVAPGAATITATHVASGKAGSAALTVTAPVPIAEVPATGLPSSGGPLPASGSYPYKITGLDPALEYLVILSPPSVPDATPAELRPTVEVHPNAAFAADWLCSSWSGGPPCRAGVPNASGEIFILVTGNENAKFKLDVKPLPVLVAGTTPVTGTVDDTETYYKVEGLVAPGIFQHTFFPADISADVFSYDRAGGPFGFAAPVGATIPYPVVAIPGLLCSTARAQGPLQPTGFGALPPPFAKSCLAPNGASAAVPLAGAVYLTVEGWLTAAGTNFTLQP